MSSFPPACCCWQGTCREGLRRRGGQRRGRARAGPEAGRVARRSGPAQALAPFPVPGRSSLWTSSCCWGGWLVLVRGCDACRAFGGGLQSGAALIDVRLDVGPLPPRSSSPTVAGCRLGGFPVGRDRWGGERVVGGVLPRINIGTDVRGESSIMTGVYERWCSSTLHIGWGLCDRLCLVLVCRGRYGLGEVVLLFILGSSLG